jgi:hypothetical protein
MITSEEPDGSGKPIERRADQSRRTRIESRMRATACVDPPQWLLVEAKNHRQPRALDASVLLDEVTLCVRFQPSSRWLP